MRLCFDTIQEVKDFVGQLKGQRGKKDDGDTGDATAGAPGPGAAPAPLAPPQGSPMAAATAPAAFTPPAGFPGTTMPAVAPEVTALVSRIVAKMDALLAGGATPADQMLGWFRTACQPAGDTSNATMDQIKTALLPKLSVQALDTIAKSIAA